MSEPLVPVLPSAPYTFTQALARQEGFYASITSRPYRNHNPGDIMWDGPSGFAARHGALSGDGGPFTPMAVFPTLEAGFAAQRELLAIQAHFRVLKPGESDLKALVVGFLGARIEQVIYKWCPPSAPGNTPAGTEAYCNNVAHWMQLPRTKVLTREML